MAGFLALAGALPACDAPTAVHVPPPTHPNAENTGPTGTLTPYTGSCTISANGTVIDSKIVNCDLTIDAAGVTIRNSQITGSVETVDANSNASFLLVDSIVDAGDGPATGVGYKNFQMLRTEVYGGNRSVSCENHCVIQDSYVHGQFRDASGSAHESGIRMSSNSTLIHNSIACDAPDVPPDGGCSAGLTGYGDYAVVQNNLIHDNLFKNTTGGFCAYGGSSPGKPYSNGVNRIRFIGNRFERGVRTDHGEMSCGRYGAITDFDHSAPGNEWIDNAYVDGTVINP